MDPTKDAAQDSSSSSSAVPASVSLKSFPVRAYLDATVVPMVLLGMSELAKTRPEDPLQWLGQYLINAHQAQQQQQQQQAQGQAGAQGTAQNK